MIWFAGAVTMAQARIVPDIFARSNLTPDKSNTNGTALAAHGTIEAETNVGAGGNVLEEARLQAETTKFMDYVGVVDETGSPLLLVEAKAWDKPFVSARAGGAYDNEADLIVAAIQHVCAGKSEDASPAIAEWHRYLRQVAGYVRTLKEDYGHDLPRAVIVSGEWLVVFKRPVEIFLGRALSADVVIFKCAEFKGRAGEIFKLLHRSSLTEDAPIPLRPTQLRHFIDLASVAGAFHGVHVLYERSGSSLFAPRPRISVYPAVFVVSKDDATYTVIDSDTPVELGYQQDGAGGVSLTPHLDANAKRAAKARSGNENWQTQVTSLPNHHLNH